VNQSLETKLAGGIAEKPKSVENRKINLSMHPGTTSIAIPKHSERACVKFDFYEISQNSKFAR
jgi:hypothetical protein